MAFVFYAYAYDVITCQGRLNVVYDTTMLMRPHLQLANATTFTSTEASTSTVASSSTSTPPPSAVLNYINKFTNNNNNNNSSHKALLAARMSGRRIVLVNEANDVETLAGAFCGHVVTTYIVPSLLHLIAYILGFIYFRINENEQLYALMEKVFLAVNQTLKMASQDRVIKRLK